jgi:pimeloyl-ACP methyl ester carboxylesterase
LDTVPPFRRESGAVPTVLCLHANASTSSQWRALSDALSPQFRVVATDGLGAGRSPPWPERTDVRLADEMALLAPVLAEAGAQFHLVGHSYGGAIAVKIALTMPQRVASLVLFEPTLFALLEHVNPGRAAAAGIADAAATAAAAIDRGDTDAAARAFIDYWMGAGAWDATPEVRRSAMAGSMRNVRGWADALFGEPPTAADLALLRTPVLLLGRQHSPASAREALRLLARVWPQAETAVLPGIGHMGPVTHPQFVNEHVVRFLSAHR